MDDFAALDDKVSFTLKNDNTLKIVKKFVNSGESVDMFYSQLKCKINVILKSTQNLIS